MLSYVVIDFETSSACDLRVVGGWRYSEDPSTEILCLGYDKNIWLPGETDPVLLSLVQNDSVTFVAHNAAFEKAIWRNIMVKQYGWPDIPNSRWHDSMSSCAMRAIPLRLDKAAEVLQLPMQKQKFNVKALSKPKKDGSYDRSAKTLGKVYDYCRQDVLTEIALHERVGWLPPGERSVWLLDQRINERGVRLDLEFVRAAKKIVEDASKPLAAEFRDLTGGLAFTQRDKVLAWCKEQGAEIPNLQKETIATLLGESDAEDENDSFEQPDVKLPDQVARALKIRSLVGSASVKKLARMEACVCADERARGLLQYHGAGPGRWAGRLLQPQNFPRGTNTCDPETAVAAIMTGDYQYVEAVIGPAIETVVSSLRHAIIASPGRTLVVGDFAGVEARIVLALAGQHDKTAIMASGQNIYCDMAKAIYGRNITKDDKEEYLTGKAAVLGLGYQCGWEKFQNRMAKDKTEQFCRNIVDTYRQEWAPNVPKLWYSLEDAAVAAVWENKPREAYGVRYQMEEGWLTARLPSGRKLWYFNPRPERKAMPYDPTIVKRAFTYQAQKLNQWKTISAYGGLLTENVVQGLARDIMVAAMFKAENSQHPIILTVHDELVCEPLLGEADPERLRKVMVDIPDWAKELQIPIDAECWMDTRWRK